MTLYQLLYKSHKEETVVRRNFGNQASRVHPSEIERYCFRAQRTERMTSVGLVLVFNLRASEAEKLKKVTKYVLLYLNVFALCYFAIFMGLFTVSVPCRHF